MPTGWNSITDDNVLPRLSSREPKVPVSDVEMRSPEPVDGGSDDSESEGSVKAPPELVTRMAEESSDDSDFPKAKVRDKREYVRPQSCNVL